MLVFRTILSLHQGNQALPTNEKVGRAAPGQEAFMRVCSYSIHHIDGMDLASIVKCPRTICHCSEINDLPPEGGVAATVANVGCGSALKNHSL